MGNVGSATNLTNNGSPKKPQQKVIKPVIMNFNSDEMLKKKSISSSSRNTVNINKIQRVEKP